MLQVALEDPVFRWDKQVGSVITIVWERVLGSLTVEFDPIPPERIGLPRSWSLRQGRETWEIGLVFHHDLVADSMTVAPNAGNNILNGNTYVAERVRFRKCVENH